MFRNVNFNNMNVMTLEDNTTQNIDRRNLKSIMFHNVLLPLNPSPKKRAIKIAKA